MTSCHSLFGSRLQSDELTPLQKSAPGRRCCLFAVASLSFRCSLGCSSCRYADSEPKFLRRTGSRQLIIRCKKQQKQRAHLRDCRGNTLAEEGANDRLPFFLQGRGRDRAAGAVILAALERSFPRERAFVGTALLQGGFVLLSRHPRIGDGRRKLNQRSLFYHGGSRTIPDLETRHG